MLDTPIADRAGETVGDSAYRRIRNDVIFGTLEPGQKLKLELENEGNAEHNFRLADQNIDQDVEAGEKAEVTVTIPESGEISFVCKYHEQLGMAGALAAG